ncbi:MAG: acyl-CoA dehydrogenase [Pseudomonadota bacterium]
MYRAPLQEMTFCAEMLGQSDLAATERFSEATPETRTAILDEAARLCEGVLVPLNWTGDREGAHLENGVVRTPEGFRAGFEAIAEGGWIGATADPAHGGMGLPQCLGTMVQEILFSSCMALASNPMLTQGQIEALEVQGSEALKATLLPKLISGQWTGTMNLSEPQAGSDVGAVRTRAEDLGDGTFALHGQKIWITWGDHDLAENICHLVLARLPEAPAGTKGLSLFAVPKLWSEDGRPATPNNVRTISLERKLGLHASPTCVLEYDGARGWLVGPPQGGMAAMFVMMNNARLGVGVQGLGIAEAALQKATTYALERRQGATPDGSPTIAGFADVRRMLARMQAMTQAARALCYDCALSIDLARAAGSEAVRRAHTARAGVLTPLAKAFGTRAGIEVADLGIQVHGGIGYVEDTGAAQLWRDVRVSSIYEGTNGIQAMDLVGRKLSLDDGEAVRGLLSEVEATVDAAHEAGHPELARALAAARSKAEGVTGKLLTMDSLNDRFAGATPYLDMLAGVLGAHYLLRAGLRERARLPLARFAVHQMLPRAHADAQAAIGGAEPLYAIALGG